MHLIFKNKKNFPKILKSEKTQNPKLLKKFLIKPKNHPKPQIPQPPKVPKTHKTPNTSKITNIIKSSKNP